MAKKKIIIILLPKSTSKKKKKIEAIITFDETQFLANN